jgi:hypothetical protein
MHGGYKNPTKKAWLHIKKMNKKQHKKERGGDEPSIGRPEYGGVLEKTVVSRVRMSS